MKLLFVIIVLLLLPSALLGYVYVWSVEQVRKVWRGRIREDDAAWFDRQFRRLEELKSQESSQSVNLSTVAQEWSVNLNLNVATVYDRGNNIVRNYEFTNCGIVKDANQSVVVNLCLVHLLPPDTSDVGQMRTRSYSRFHNPRNLTMQGGLVSFGTIDSIELPLEVPARAEVPLELKTQCSRCRFVHWQVYGGRLLVCSLHPEGKLGCGDWELNTDKFLATGVDEGGNPQYVEVASA